LADDAGRARPPPTPEPTPAPAAKVTLDIDPAVTGGLINDRYDVLVHGRVAASQPVESIALLLDGAVISQVGFGTTADSAPCQQAFHVNVPLRRADAVRKCKCSLVAKLTNGDVHEQRYEFVLDAAGGAPVTIASGRTVPMSIYADLRPAIILYVERAVLDDSGRLQLIGWAVSQNPMASILVFLGDERIEGVRVAGRRDDVGAAYPGYPNARTSGFSLAAHVLAEVDDPSTIRVQAVTRSGFSQEVNVPLERVPALDWSDLVEKAVVKNNVMQFATEPTYRLVAGFQIGPGVPGSLSTSLPAVTPMLGSTPVAPEPTLPADQRRHIRFYCDDISLDSDGQLSVNGWSVCAVGISAVSIYLDDNKVGDAELGLLRDDVGDEYRHIPMARYSGFHLKQALGEVPSGERRIRVVVRNGLDDVREENSVVPIDRPARKPSQSNPQQFRLEIDTPTLAAGAAVEPITGRLTIEGWALARSGISGIEVLLDDQWLGDAHFGLARQDVGSAFPDWTDSLRSGYAFHCPPRSLRNGEHVVQLNVRARSGEVFEYRFNIQVRKSEESEEGSGIRRRMTLVEANVARQVLDGMAHRPGFRLLLRQGSMLDIAELLATLQSLRSQVYRDWRLEIGPADAYTARAVRALIAEAAGDLSERIDVLDPIDDTLPDQPLGWSEGTITPRFVGLLGAGDQLGCDALLQIALATGLQREADLIYADESRVSPVTHDHEPFFKPDYSPDLLLSTNYFGRPWFASAALLGRCGATTRELQENGEYDLALRCAERATYIHHVPKLLCLRGAQPIDDAEMEAAALARAAARLGTPAEVKPTAIPGTWRLRRTRPVSGKVSIIIPTCGAKGYIETCIKSLRERTAYPNIEIVCVDNIPDDQIAWKIWLQQNADKIAPTADAFNWSRFNNLGAEVATGEYLLFLNDDIEVVQPDWLDALLEHAQRPEVAVVGPQLLYPDNKVQHAGMFLATLGTARHAFRFGAADEPGYFGLALTQRNVIAVTGACMLMRRTVYEALGRFDEAHQIINNDLDFCLRAHEAGKLTVYTPYATLLHYEAASRDRMKDVFDLVQFEERWRTIFATGDPYFSPRLTRHSDDYRPDDEPAEVIYAGHPLFRDDEIKRILVVKVDHIGDFVTAIPAIRRLKQIFPGASIHVLAGRAARAFAEIEDCIDEFIEFEFFHAVSGLGQKEISKEEYEDLRERLRPYRFDIAVDLRKHLDTRDVLRYTPARFLAGYDYMGQFPFLDISLEWEGDRHLLRKRSHVTDDLINLVEAIGTAGTSDRTQLNLVAQSSGAPEFLPDYAKALFNRPVVAVHPGVGNIMRQWPVEHFASLVDLLIEKNAINVVLIGGPEEKELAEQVQEHVMHREAVVSLVGRTSLRQLPELLRACALYVGNNSGPKHIAAALGVPTIGIHSGVVDAIEWGPIGARAVAVRRNMSCSPCYLARTEDCPRAFACMRGLEPIAVQEVAEIFLAQPVLRPAVTSLVEPVFVAPVPEPLARPEPAEAASPSKVARRRSPGGEQPPPRSRRRRSRQDATVSAD
jgi:ADP-heptose:LPS heptosyltransferase/GT2 family glycosyltransferase